MRKGLAIATRNRQSLIFTGLTQSPASMVHADRLCAVFSALRAEKTAHSNTESTALPKAQHTNCEVLMRFDNQTL